MKTILTILLFAGLSSCTFRRIGDLTIVSNRNIDNSKTYELLYRNAEAKVRMRKDDALDNAIDKVTDKYSGEYLMNAKIYISTTGRRLKVVGDVYGIK